MAQFRDLQLKNSEKTPENGQNSGSIFAEKRLVSAVKLFTNKLLHEMLSLEEVVFKGGGGGLPLWLVLELSINLDQA